ncbi:hypothetical protein WJX72_011475 [[Myrmecia] bisecta]|uniref:Uncharacterized protein n=1 Tax=[Myrmecia] bisecta TaxID=41462 RepID=A0AAW1PER4_9CHLO
MAEDLDDDNDLEDCRLYEDEAFEAKLPRDEDELSEDEPDTPRNTHTPDDKPGSSAARYSRSGRRYPPLTRKSIDSSGSSYPGSSSFASPRSPMSTSPGSLQRVSAPQMDRSQQQVAKNTAAREPVPSPMDEAAPRGSPAGVH